MRLYLSIRRQGLKREQQKPPTQLLKQAARLTIAKAAKWQLPNAVDISLLLTNDAGIQGLNRDFRNLDKPTDVLSFPLWEEQPIIISPDEPLELGDIAISLERAAAQAGQYGHSENREAVFLFVHGLLHLLGYDHEQGKKQEEIMFSLQEQIMLDLDLPR